jgi:hypothetical protein
VAAAALPAVPVEAAQSSASDGCSMTYTALQSASSPPKRPCPGGSASCTSSQSIPEGMSTRRTMCSVGRRKLTPKAGANPAHLIGESVPLAIELQRLQSSNYPSFGADIDAVQNGCMDSSLSHGHAAWGYHSGRTLVSVVTANPGTVGRGGSGRVAQGPSGGRVARTSNAAITTAPAIVLVRIVLIGCSRLYSDSSVVPATESPNIACC